MKCQRSRSRRRRHLLVMNSPPPPPSVPVGYRNGGSRVRRHSSYHHRFATTAIYLVETDDVVVLEHFQYLDFSVELTQVAFVQLALVHNLDRHL